MKRLAVSAHLLLTVTACGRTPEPGANPGTSATPVSSTPPATEPAPRASASAVPVVATRGTPFVVEPRSTGTDFDAQLAAGEAKARKTHAWAEIGAGTLEGGAVANVGNVVWGMHFAFDRCVDQAFKADAHSVKSGATLELVAKIGAGGEVLTVTPSGHGMPGEVVTCMAARVSSAQFAPPAGGAATVKIPVTAKVP